jgi:putative ubiquitin-RnfH superfamily antitoxin RatB of RatAB toxin-antitoxin module
MNGPAVKRASVAYAARARQYLWEVGVPGAATIGEALAVARAQVGERCGTELIPWDTAPVGIYGEVRQRSDGFEDGDRIELYRPLERDPRVRRREKVARERRAAR